MNVTARLVVPRAARALRLAACLTLLAAASTAAPAGAEPAEISGWQALLDRYVVTVSTPKQPLDTRVDYATAFMDDDMFNHVEARRLKAVRAQLLAVPPSRMTREERLAWAINTYNFLVFERIAANVVIKGKKNLWRYGDVREVISGAGSFFETELVEIEGRRYSLETLERTFVYGDSTPLPEPRRKSGDPRLMFALYRGTMGGPILQPRAYRPDSLEAQLDHALRVNMASSRFARPGADRRQVEVSDYLAWNALDYGGTSKVIEFVDRWGPADVRKVIRKEKPTQPGRWQEYDWSINHAPRRSVTPLDAD